MQTKGYLSLYQKIISITERCSDNSSGIRPPISRGHSGLATFAEIPHPPELISIERAFNAADYSRFFFWINNASFDLPSR